MLTAQRQQIILNATLKYVVLTLNEVELTAVKILMNLLDANVSCTNSANLALFLELIEGATVSAIGVSNVEQRPVSHVKIDVIGAKALQRLLQPQALQIPV